jgi:hypothetical protein
MSALWTKNNPVIETPPAFASGVACNQPPTKPAQNKNGYQKDDANRNYERVAHTPPNDKS